MERAEKQRLKMLLFASPCLWPLLLMVIALAVWKVGISEPDLVPLAGLCLAITVAARFLARGRYWVSLPMAALGIFLFFALGQEQHFGGIIQIYGAYLTLHYLICGMYGYIHIRPRSR